MRDRWELSWRAALVAAAFLGGEETADAAASARLFYGRAPDVQGCPDETALRSAIAERVGYDPIFPIAPNSIAISLRREGEQLVANVTLADRNGLLVGSRALRAPADQCGELTATIALTVAISLDTLEKRAPPDPPPPPPSQDASPNAGEFTEVPRTPIETPETPPSPAISSTNAPVAEASLPRAVERSQAYGEVGAAMTSGIYGVAPSPSLGATAFGSVRWSRLELGVEGRVDLPSSSSVPTVPGARARTSLLGAGPVLCLHFGDLFGCTVGLIGAVHASAPGVTGSSSGDALEILAGLRLGLAIPLGGGVELRASADLFGDPTKPIVRAGGEDLWNQPAVAIASEIGIAMKIP